MTVKILDLLKRKKVTIAEFARTLGTSYQSAHKMAHQESRPPRWVERYLALVTATSSTPDELHEFLQKWAKKSGK